MRDKEPLAARRRVNGLLADRDAAEGEAQVVPGGFVVVAGDVDDGGALARLAQHLLDDVVVRLVPVPAPLQLPAVDDVADEVEVLRFGATQELEERARLAPGRAQMGVGNPDRAEPQPPEERRVVGIGRPLRRRRFPSSETNSKYAAPSHRGRGLSCQAACLTRGCAFGGGSSGFLLRGKDMAGWWRPNAARM